MKTNDMTEKDVKIPSDAQTAPASEARKTAAHVKELADEQIAAVGGGGIQGNHIGIKQ